MVQTYEYRVAHLSGEPTRKWQDDLNWLGTQGWELVEVIPLASTTGIRVSEVTAFLKRPIDA